MEFNKAFNKLLKNESFRKEWQKYDLAFEISEQIINLRVANEKSQQELAKMLNTKQPSIARLEGGGHMPSLTMLNKIAKVFNKELRVEFVPQHTTFTQTQEAFTFVSSLQDNVAFSDKQQLDSSSSRVAHF